MSRFTALLGVIIFLGAACYPKSGSIEITTRPEGAEVYLNDNPTHQKTNTTVENLDFDAYTLRLSATGYADWVQSVTLTQERSVATIDVDLDKNEMLFAPESVGTRYISLAWSSADPTTSWQRYEVYRSDSPDPAQTGNVVYTRGNNRYDSYDTTWTDTDIYPCTDYYYVVAYVDGSGGRIFSNELAVTTPCFSSIQLPFEGGHGLRLAQEGNIYFFTAAREKSVRGLNLNSGGLSPGAIFQYPDNNTSNWAYDLVTVGDIGFQYVTLHVAFGVGGYCVYNIENPSNPSLSKRLSSTALAGQARAVDVSGECAFVASLDEETPAYQLHRIDWCGTTLNITASRTLSGEPTDIDVDSGYVYVTCGNGRLEIFAWDPTDSTSLTPLSSISTGAAANRVVVDSTYAYVAASTQGLLVIDVSNPASPYIAGQWRDLGRGNDAEGLYVLGNTVYLADGEHGLRAIDISSPQDPQHLFTIDLTQAVGNYRLLDVWITSRSNLSRAVLTDWHNLAFYIEW